MKTSYISLIFPLMGLTACVWVEADDLAALCAENATVLTLNEATALGFSAEDVLALAAGEHQAPIHWRNTFRDGDLELEMGPETGEGEFTVSIAYDGGEIRFIRSDSQNTDELDDSSSMCPDRVEIDVVTQITTAGGALGETLSSVLSAETERFAQIATELDLRSLSGSFQVTSQDPRARATDTYLEFGVSEFGVQGSIYGIVETETKDWVSATAVTYASFPWEDTICTAGEIAIPMDVAFDGFSGADVLNLINGDRTDELSWNGSEGVPLTVRATYDGDHVCVTPSNDHGRIHLAASVEVLTEDGSLTAHFPVWVTAWPDDVGQLASVSLVNTPFGQLLPIDEFETAVGSFPTDLSRFDDAGLEFFADLNPTSEPGHTIGSLALVGATRADCTPNGNTPCPSHGDIAEVARGEWRSK